MTHNRGSARDSEMGQMRALSSPQAARKDKPRTASSDLGLSYARGVLELRGGRVIVMTEAAYVLLLQVLHEHAPHTLKYAFYDMGYRAGIDIMAALEIAEGHEEMALRRFVEQFTQAGYGAIEITHLDLSTPEVRLQGDNLFEAGLAPTAGIYRTPRAVDHYSRGMFAGFVSELLKREVVCEEVACQFRGDPHCEFVVLPFQE